ncbi:glycosyltransferase family 4 protein [Vallitalea pronyensis]|uniref:Glycosyltransferase family 4 protein n=1 Tax=Vallitalea pronyensis TaxID=1348613 RepID=A0A8J8MP30_9FIRM|nr:glycosyltransferase family 4 protein [Vallitalea pronyensis]QUI24768.1 glycosyltransferase family 4 protein [Vallitalea pronyensis]
MIKALLKVLTHDRISGTKLSQKTKLIHNDIKKTSFHMVYVMGNTSICGAAKMIFQQANTWIEKGHQVTIVAYGKKPSWFPINSAYICVPAATKLSTCIPYCDLIIATYYTHIGECVETGIAPVAYFEQGDHHVFAYHELEEDHKAFIQSQYHLAHFILTVSHVAAKYIKQYFNRESTVIRNGIDTHIFKYKMLPEKKKTYLLMVGNDRYDFKGIPHIIAAYKRVREKLPHIKLYWITPVTPTIDVEDVSKVFVAPSQRDIAAIYQGASVYIQGSYYEAFGLPILEAMACGCPVITTDCIGMRDYVIHGQNAIVLKNRLPKTMADAVINLLQKYDIRRNLIAGGLKTAGQYGWRKISKHCMSTLKNMAVYQIEPRQNTTVWDIQIHGKDFLTTEGYAKFLQYLQTTSYSEIFVPILYEITKDLTIARWTCAAKRYEGGSGKGYCYTKVRRNTLSENAFIRSIYHNIKTEQYRDALKELTCLTVNNDEEVIYKRWFIYCLIQIEDYPKALIALSHIPEQKGYTDYDYLYCLIYSRLGQVEKARERFHAIKAYQEAIVYDEFIVDIEDAASKVMDNANVEQLALPKLHKEGNQLSMEEMYEFAMQLYENELYDDSIYYFLEYVKEEQEDKEKCIDAYRNIYLIYYDKEDYDVCRKYCYQIFEYDAPRAEECCFIGYTLMKEEKWDEAIFWYELATELELPRHDAFPIDKDAWTWRPYLQLCVCYYENGETEKAFLANETAHKLNPQHKSVIQNIAFFKSKGYVSSDD